MHKIPKILLSAALSAAVLLGGFGLSYGGKAQAAEDYYVPITAEGGDELLGQLHDLITTTHTRYSSYENCRDYAKTTDPALNGEDGIVEFYTHETIRYYINDISASSGTWNREHVWPKSLSGGKWGTDGAGADMHHIRPSEQKMNSSRGNDKFGEVASGSPVYSKTTSGANSQLGGYHAGGVFEPLDFAKGDAARIVMYVYTHYNTYANVHGTTNGGGNSSYFGNLPITNIISASSQEAAFALLLEWNELDPVDEIETLRNEEVFKFQHNRNPFIDHPEYVRMIWGSETPDPDPDPTPDPDPDPTPDPDTGKALAAFKEAVEALEDAETLQERFACINAAYSAYRALPESFEETENDVEDYFAKLVEEYVARLREAVEAYNADVAAHNGDLAAAEAGAVGGVVKGGGAI